MRKCDTEKRNKRTVITRGLLLEISAVPVPANVNTLVLNMAALDSLKLEGVVV